MFEARTGCVEGGKAFVRGGSLRRVSVGRWGRGGEAVVARVRANVVRREKRGGESPGVRSGSPFTAGAGFFPCIPRPTRLLVLITGIAVKMGTEESSGFVAEERRGCVLRDAVVLQKRSRSRAYVQKNGLEKGREAFRK